MAATDFVTETQIDSLTTTIASAVKANTTAQNAHLNDTSDAHDASAISVLDVATKFTATDVEAALAEVKTLADAAATSSNLTAHISDATAAHAASAISYAGGTGMSATDVEAAIDELATEKANDSALTAHISDASAAHAASAISILDTGTLYTAADVEAALAEVKTIADASTAHISDATAAHAASAISIADVGAKFTATDVEAALAEVKTVADAAAGGGVAINDAVTNTTATWSSQKSTDYVAAQVSALIDSAPGVLDTLNELAAAVGDDAAFSTTVTTALAARLRFDAAQTLTSPQKAQALANLGIVASAVNFATNFTAALV